MSERLKELLAHVVPPDELSEISNSYDVVGDIAILRLTDSSRKYGRITAEAVMGIHKNVKTVLAQTSPVHGDFRLRGLEYLAGENRSVTVHKESGMSVLRRC